MVFVLDKHKKPLMPCTEKRARLLLERGRARVVRIAPFTVDDLIAQTAGVESRKDAAVIDEIPSAYKSIDAVIAAQSDLIEPVVRLKQVLCVKG